MKKHKFNKIEVMMTERRISNTLKESKFRQFVSLSEELGFTVKRIRGNIFTHLLIEATEEDFNTLLELL